MRLAWRLALREVRRRKGRTAMVALLVALTVGGLTTADLSYRSHNLPSDSDFGAAQLRLSLNPSIAAPAGLDQASMDNVLAELPKGAEVATGAETGGLPVQRADRPGLGVHVTLTTVDLSSPVLRGATTIREGRLASAADEVTLGTETAERLQVAVGDSLHLAYPDVTFRVVGLADRSSGERLLFHAPGFPVDLMTPGATPEVAYVAGVPADWYPSNGNAAFVGVEYRPTVREPAPEEILIIWLAMTLLLSVLGIVIAAAFAASGRRQLLTIGQLGANGGDQRLARRFLGLQGAVTSIVGAVVGIAGGAVVAAALGDPVLRRDRWDVRGFDLLVIVGTTVAVGTAAALLPTRTLASTPILTALAGRAPVKQVRPYQVPAGIAAVVGGLAVLGLSVSSATNGGSDSLKFVAAILGGFSVLGGVCALSPVIVDRWQWLGRRSTGTARLAIRSMVRHRARSAALVAAIAAVGAAGVAGASGVERWSQLDRGVTLPPMLDTVSLGTETFTIGADALTPAQIEGMNAEIEDQQRVVDSIVDGIRWGSVRWVYGQDGVQAFVADDATLTALGVPAAQWPLARTGEPRLFARTNDFVGGGANAVVPTLRVSVAYLIDPAAVAASPTEWKDLPPVRIGVAPKDLTDEQRLQLTSTTFAAQYRSWYEAAPADLTGFAANAEYPSSSTPVLDRSQVRWLLVAGLLLLVTLIVSIGLSLWAAEGRVERDQLVAVGAPPAALARLAGARAWVIAATGGVIAVPLGWVTLWTILDAAGKQSPFPTITALMVVLVIPVVVAIGATATSRLAQAVRPVTATTMSVD